MYVNILIKIISQAVLSTFCSTLQTLFCKAWLASRRPANRSSLSRPEILIASQLTTKTGAVLPDTRASERALEKLGGLNVHINCTPKLIPIVISRERIQKRM